MNNNLAAQASSPSRSLVTIFPFDFTSFITDHQQTWLSQPPSSAASAQSTHQHYFDKDFELFGTVPENRNPHNSSLRPATQNIHPSSPFPQQPPHRQLAQAQLAHLSTTGYNQLSTNQRSISSPTLHQHPSYSQHLSNLRKKPPVPLFSNTTVNRQVPRRRLQSDSAALAGKQDRATSTQGERLTVLQDPEMAFDDLYLTGGDDLFVSPEEAMTGLDHYPTSNFTAVNSSPAMHNTATVSPQELLNSFATPESSYLESPMMGSSAYATTPLEDGGFMDETLDFSSMDMPLFPQDGMNQFMETPMQRVHSQSFTQSSSASPMVRQRSGPSPGSRPGTAHSRKHSLVAGVAKASATKSRKALPEIVIQEDDAKEIAKRKKNTAAARKSRENRANRMEALEAEVPQTPGYCFGPGCRP